MKPILVIGVGNTERGDDGLGWAFVKMLEEYDQYEIAYRYQLQVEDAELISHYDKVWIVDASHKHYKSGFKCMEIISDGGFLYTTHSLHPGVVLNLCMQLYSHTPEVYMLGISGEDYKLGQRLSEAAKVNLANAFTYFTKESDLNLLCGKTER